MRVYLASPNTQQQAEHCADMSVLLSFALFKPWVWQYQPTFDGVLVDCGAFSVLRGGKEIDRGAYREFGGLWRGHADAIAGIDDIKGDFRKSMANYKAIEWTFPTWHDTDPPEALDELIAMAQERDRWLGIGLLPPRHGKERILRAALDRIPDDIHIHGWALRAYTHLRRIDSVDSTNWWRDAMKLRQKLNWLTYGECLNLMVKKYQRWGRAIHVEIAQNILFGETDESEARTDSKGEMPRERREGQISLCS